MASPRASSDPKRPPGTPAAPRTYAAGTRITGTVYQVVKILGAGGMGTVYEVEDTSVGKRYVLKTLHPELGDREDLARRMQNEARVLARLQHPNIVEVVTAGVTADDLRLPFYVMERLEGQNIRVVIEKMRRLSVPHAVRITIDLLDALDRAHESGVVHRDVKPDNIFLHRAPSGSTVTKLLDFGIMRLLDGGRGDTAGRFLGTLRYAAPEQLRGEALSPQTDLYAAGLVLYEMIAGRGPFDDLGSAAAIGRAHLKDAPPALTRFAPEVPVELARLIDQSLAKDATMRPRDAFTFASELRGLQKMLKPSPPSGSVPSRTMATEVNVLGSIETAVEPRSSARTAAPFSATQRVAAPSMGAASSYPAPSLAATKLSGPAGDLAGMAARSDAGGTDVADAGDLGYQQTQRHDMFSGLGNGTEASVPGVSLDNDADADAALAGQDAAEDVKVEALVDRYALTRTSAEEALSIGPRHGFSAAFGQLGQPGQPGHLGPGGTEDFVLPVKPRVEVAPYAAAPPSIMVSSTPPQQMAPSFAAPPALSEGRNDPTVRRKPGPHIAWIVAGALVSTSVAFGFYVLGTRHAGAAPAASVPVAAPAPAPVPSAPPAPTAAAPVVTATADQAPASPPVEVTAPPPPPVVAAPPPHVAPSPAPSPTPKPAAKAPKPATPPPHAVAGPPRVSSGL